LLFLLAANVLTCTAQLMLIVYSRIIYIFISVNFICLKRQGFIVLSFTLHAVKCHPISSFRESQQSQLLYIVEWYWHRF